MMLPDCSHVQHTGVPCAGGTEASQDLHVNGPAARQVPKLFTDTKRPGCRFTQMWPWTPTPQMVMMALSGMTVSS